MNQTTELEKIKESITPILKKHNVTKAGLFGSVARGEHTKKSDVDLLIDVSLDVDLIDLAKLKNALQKKLKRKVDLVEYTALRQEIRNKVLKEEVPLFA